MMGQSVRDIYLNGMTMNALIRQLFRQTNTAYQVGSCSVDSSFLQHAR